MKRMKFLAIMMLVVLMIVGCGSKEAEIEMTEAAITMTNSAESSSEESQEKEEEVVEKQEFSTVQEEILAKAGTIDIESFIVEKSDDELDLKQFLYSYEDRTMDKEEKQLFYTEWFESNPKSFITTDKIDIYNISGIRIGYALKNVRIESFGEYDGWYYFYLDGNRRFARIEDVEANSKVREQKADEPVIKEEAEGQEQYAVNTKTPTETAPVEQPVASHVEAPIETNTYTAEDAIADYRAILEVNGIAFDPSIKEFASWGTGMLPLNKEQVEAFAYSSVESCAVGDSVGHPYTKYYLEVTGSDENYVYYTKYVSS